MFSERNDWIIGGWELAKVFIFIFYNEFMKWYNFKYAYFFGGKVLFFAEYEQITPYHHNVHTKVLC